MERYILRITTEETYVSGQIFAVRDFDEAVSVIKDLDYTYFSEEEENVFRTQQSCILGCSGGFFIEAKLMKPLEYHAMIKQEYENRRSEVIRLCGELSASQVEG